MIQTIEIPERSYDLLSLIYQAVEQRSDYEQQSDEGIEAWAKRLTQKVIDADD